MQNQRTQQAPDTELDDLSVQEEALVEALGLGMDNCAAYRKAYGAEGYGDAALRVRACRKVAEPQIQAHLRKLRSVGFANSKLTIENRVADELAFAQRAEDAGNFGAAGGAHDRVNKLLGHYVENVNHTFNAPENVLEEIRKLNPALADQLAADNLGAEYHGETLQ